MYRFVIFSVKFLKPKFLCFLGTARDAFSGRLESINMGEMDGDLEEIDSEEESEELSSEEETEESSSEEDIAEGVTE